MAIREEKEEEKILYGMYKRKEGLFKKFRFRQMMSSAESYEIRSVIKKALESNNFQHAPVTKGYDRLSVDKLLVELLNDYPSWDVKSLHGKIKNHTYYSPEEDVTKMLCRKIKLSDSLSEGIIADFPAKLILQGIKDVRPLVNCYGDALFECMTSSDMGVNTMWGVRSSNDSRGEYTFSNIDEDFDSYEDLLQYYKNRPPEDRYVSDEDKPIINFNDLLQLLLEKYTIDELRTNVETIKKEIRTGFIFYLPFVEASQRDNDPNKSAFLRNREVIDKMLDHCDANTFSIIMNAEKFLKPILTMISEAKLDPEDKENLKHTYAMFTQISKLAKAKKFDELLTLIESEEKMAQEAENTPDLKFADIINDRLLDYEIILRKDITQNTRSFAKVKNNSELSNEIGMWLSVEGKSVEHLDQLSTTLVSDVRPAWWWEVDTVGFAMAGFQRMMEKKLYGGVSHKIDSDNNEEIWSEEKITDKAKEEALDLTEKFYNLVSLAKNNELSRSFTITNLVKAMKPDITPEELASLGLPKKASENPYGLEEKEYPQLSMDELRECIDAYKELQLARDGKVPSKYINHTNRVFKFVDENWATEREKEKVTSRSEALCEMFRLFLGQGMDPKKGALTPTHIIRLTNEEDFHEMVDISDVSKNRNFIDRVKFAVSYDAGTIPEESIIISAIKRIGADRRQLGDNGQNGDAYYSKYPVGERSATLEMLETTKVKEHIYPYDNAGEIDVMSDVIKPSNLVVFYNSIKSPEEGKNGVVTEQTGKLLEDASKTAKEFGMGLVLVDCTSICRELRNKTQQAESEFYKRQGVELKESAPEESIQPEVAPQSK